jgi:cytochrome c biogenesis protein CcmG/thiol:disulfide interchange protein DsbE
MTVETDLEPSPARRPWWRRWRLWSTVVVVLVAGVVVTLAVRSVGDPPGVAGHGAAPAFDLEPVRDGEPRVRLADHAGAPVVVNFWASWCVPCRREMPAFAETHAAVGEQVVFLGVNHADDRDAALSLLADTGVRYPSGFDPAGRTALDYGLIGMPTTVFIDPDGQILEQHTGELSADELFETIERLFDVAAP